MPRLVNLTPHPIVVRHAWGDLTIPPSGTVARVASTPGRIRAMRVVQATCRCCAGTASGAADGLTIEDADHLGGLSPCGDLHDWSDGSVAGPLAVVVDVADAPAWGEVVGLPDRQLGTLFIVSALVAARLTMRSDVVAPGTGPADEAVRDDQGRIVAVTRLVSS